jgi:acid phosphatase family membrane protein YuiD
MISSLLYLVYALAASAALVQGTRAATAAGAVVAAYLLLRLAGALSRLRGGLPARLLGRLLHRAPAPQAGRP